MGTRHMENKALVADQDKNALPDEVDDVTPEEEPGPVEDGLVEVTLAHFWDGHIPGEPVRVTPAVAGRLAAGGYVARR